MCVNYYLDALDGTMNKWYIDTSSIMKYWRLAKFIEKKQMLLDSRIRIIVLKPVYEELLRNQDSKDEYKADSATEGFKLIEKNQDLFEIQGYNQETRCDEAFADKDILKQLAICQNDYTQVLITDDTGLAHDAYTFNNRKSYHANKVFVCWIDQNGELQRSIAAHEEKPEPVEKIVIQEVEKTVEVEKRVPHKVYVEKERTNFQKYGGIVVSGILGLVGGYYIGQNRDQIYSLLAKAENYVRI